jgi:hypothetical protein
MNAPVAKRRTVQVIDLANYADVWFWSRYLEVTVAELKDAVSVVGVEMDAVRRYLLEVRPRHPANNHSIAFS